MTGPRVEMACATCLAPLNVLDGDYLHPLSQGNVGHPPVPVPADRLDTIARDCDFCGNQYPMWTLRGGDISIVVSGQNSELVQKYGETWAACVPCMADIDHGRKRAELHQLQVFGTRGLCAESGPGVGCRSVPDQSNTKTPVTDSSLLR